MKKFTVVDGKGENVLGGAVSEDNVYIRAYPKLVDGPKLLDLKVGEESVVEYNLSGSKGTYYVRRVE